MMAHRTIEACLSLLAVGVLPAFGCSSDSSSQELDDTEWIGANSFEVNGRIAGELVHVATGSYAELATDAELQSELVTAQISYAKNALEDAGYYLNMMPDQILSLEVGMQGDTVIIRYEASIDMVHPAVSGNTVDSVDDLPVREVTATLPHDPVDVHGRAGKSCASNYGSYTLTDEKYFYYFDPEKEGCAIETTTAGIEMVAVYPNPEVYPEYDRLLSDQGDGTQGFAAAILPNLGDGDPMSRFDAHRRELDELTELAPEAMDGFLRYRWTRDGATIVVDLFDPTEGWFTAEFHQALSNYQLVYYNGHSNYGHQPFLEEPDVYSDDYQIIGMHSCKSYSYYAHQVATGKATETDPTGWANADMIATGRSSYAHDSPHVLVALLEGLMNGLGAVVAGEDERAPSWQAIGERMRSVAPSILYGVAGARNNAWTPEFDPEKMGCSHDLCTTGAALEPTCHPCAMMVTDDDAYCKDVFWDDACVERAASLCAPACK